MIGFVFFTNQFAAQSIITSSSARVPKDSLVLMAGQIAANGEFSMADSAQKANIYHLFYSLQLYQSALLLIEQDLAGEPYGYRKSVV